jgi:hypothetical protein
MRRLSGKLLQGAQSISHRSEQENRTMASKPQQKTEKKITRARAEHDLTHGADPTLDIYTKHPNKHVTAKAAKLAAKAAPAA